MLSDPQSVTVSGTARSLPLVDPGTGSHRGYRSADGNTVLLVKQNTQKQRFRREIRLTETKVATDPLTSANTNASTSIYLVVDEPRYGFSDAELGALIEGLKAFLTPALQARILQGEM